MSWFIIAISYLIGSIPTAYIASRFLRGKDIRQMGDGNMGARNAFVELGRKTGIIIFLLDMLKGSVSILLAKLTGVPQLAVFIAGIAVVAGHNWPVFLKFRGGRGVSTTMGVQTVLFPWPVGVLAAPTILALFIWKNTTVASIVMFIGLPLLCWLRGYPPDMIAYSIVLPCLVGITHYIRTRKAMVHA